MTAASNAFERRARRLRRVLRPHPALERVANAAGVPLWRWYLRRRLAEGIELPHVVHVDPTTIRRVLPRRVLDGLGASGEPPVRGGFWDRNAIRTSEAPDSDLWPASRMAVAFDRLGRPLLVGGADPHANGEADGRLVVAEVVLRHRAWARAATEIRAYTRQRGGTAYQPYLHPDLADLPSDQGHERFDVLLEALPIRSGTLVDLGANSGYFSHRFEAAGFDCVAVERSAKEAYFLRVLRDAGERRFAICMGSLTDVRLPDRPDVVLALNIFHHFLKTTASFEALRGFLGRLSARLMLFQAPLPNDPQMARADHNMPPEEFVEWVGATSGLTERREVGRGADGRPIFLLRGPFD